MKVDPVVNGEGPAPRVHHRSVAGTTHAPRRRAEGRVGAQPRARRDHRLRSHHVDRGAGTARRGRRDARQTCGDRLGAGASEHEREHVELVRVETVPGGPSTYRRTLDERVPLLPQHLRQGEQQAPVEGMQLQKVRCVHGRTRAAGQWHATRAGTGHVGTFHQVSDGIGTLRLRDGARIGRSPERVMPSPDGQYGQPSTPRQIRSWSRSASSQRGGALSAKYDLNARERRGSSRTASSAAHRIRADTVGGIRPIPEETGRRWQP